MRPSGDGHGVTSPARRGSKVAAAPDPAATHRMVLAVWRIEQPRLMAGLARMLRDVPLAEELVQEALVAALETWPSSGAPQNPGGWLMTTARRRALDHMRRDKMLARKHAALARTLEVEEQAMPDLDSRLDDDIGDERLQLIFTACHPVLPREARAALTLRMICGLTTEEIARAFLQTEGAVGQRITRAKRTLSESGLGYETPRGEELARRMGSVLEVVYLIFNEGYAATRGDDWMRPQLMHEGLRLGRVLVAIAPQEPEAHGLLALMELNASRAAARAGPDGAPILLPDQNRDLWDWAQIRRGLVALGRAQALGGEGGFYALQAAIVACHARARRPQDTDWARIAGLYGALAQGWPSPVIELNRAIAVGFAEGPGAGLAVLDAVAQAPALQRYHLLPSVRGDLLLRLGRNAEARAEFLRGAGLAGNAQERAFLTRRAADCG